MSTVSCTHAIVSRVSPSVNSVGNGDVIEARRQHETLVRLLRELGLEVIELPPDEANAHSVFVEDTAVVLNSTALMTKPNDPLRHKDVENMKAVLKKELKLTTIDISQKDAKLEGGDVLFTGKEFFIGLSKWSNELGAKAVAEAFPEYPCTPIKVPDGGKLQKFVTLAGPDVLCVGEGKDAQIVLHRLEQSASHRYQTITVPEDVAANCLYVNKTLIHRAIEEIPLSFKVFCERVDFARRSICFSELSKISCGLTSCCLLVKQADF